MTQLEHFVPQDGSYIIDVVGAAPRRVPAGGSVSHALMAMGHNPAMVIVRLNGKLVSDTGVVFARPGAVVLVDFRVAGA